MSSHGSAESGSSSYEYYDYDGQEHDGSDEVEREVENEDPLPDGFMPQFTTEAQHFKIPAQYTVRLPCRVDRLGRHFLIKIDLLFKFKYNMNDNDKDNIKYKI